MDWARRAMCEGIWSYDVSIVLYHFRRKAAIQLTLLILVPADLQQDGMPVDLPGPFLLRQAMSRM